MDVIENFKVLDGNIYIHKNTDLGKNIKFYPFTYIDQNVSIGDNCEIGPYVSIGTKAEMPLEEDVNRKVKIKNNVTIREFVTIHSGHNRDTIIEDNVYIMNHSHIAHDCNIGENTIISAGVTLAGNVSIEESCFLGIESSVHQNSTIGGYTILGANSFAKGNLKPCLKYVGNPAKPISLNLLGIERSQKDKEYMNKLIEIAKKEIM